MDKDLVAGSEIYLDRVCAFFFFSLWDQSSLIYIDGSGRWWDLDQVCLGRDFALWFPKLYIVRTRFSRSPDLELRGGVSVIGHRGFFWGLIKVVDCLYHSQVGGVLCVGIEFVSMLGGGRGKAAGFLSCLCRV